MSGQFTNGYALLMGVNENAVQGYALPDVLKDVQALYGVLVDPERCGYGKDNVSVLVGDGATRQNMLDGLDWLQDRVAADTSGNATAVIYYSGHGWHDVAAGQGEFYLIPYDVRPDKLRSRALRAQDWAEAVAQVQPRRLLAILDCCHAAGLGTKEAGILPAGYAAAAFDPRMLMEEGTETAAPGGKGLEQLARGGGRAVLSSSTGEQRSYIRKDGKMSIFTYHLVEALTGHARPEEGATEVLVSDVMGHVYRHVPDSAQADWQRDQTPDYQVSGNFPVSLLLGGKPWAKGDLAPDPLEAAPKAGAGEGTTIFSGGGAVVFGGVEVKKHSIFVGRDWKGSQKP
jgi:hypothetical protein